jgi:hypothetical protein
MKKLALTIAAVAWIGAGAGVAHAEQETITGTISDSLCGASHKAMGEKQGSKISDRDCVIACPHGSGTRARDPWRVKT